MSQTRWRSFFEQFDKTETYLQTQAKAPGAEALTLPLLRVLEEIRFGLVRNPRLFFDLMEPSQAKIHPLPHLSFHSKNMDDSQSLAVRMALAMDNLLLIQGPPGAGKTTTIVEMIRQIRDKDPRAKILIASQSHAAVDNAMERLLREGFPKRDLCRIRQREDASPEMEDIGLERASLRYKESHGDPLFKKIWGELDQDGSFSLRNSGGIALSCGVVGSTINSVNSGGIGLENAVDYAIVDEVGKANFAEVLRIAQITDKLILIGDPKQLPAVLKQEDEEEPNPIVDFLSEHPFLDYLYGEANPAIRVMLNKQYRMCNEIGDLIGIHFYTENGKRLLFNGLDRSCPDALNYVSYDPTLFPVDSQTLKTVLKGRLTNPTETEIALKILRQELGRHKPSEIAVIVPYSAQVRALREAAKKANLPLPADRIDTVDAFQGKEANVVIFTCVRNNGHVTEFFTKPNRLNVALSRAKDKIYLIGSLRYVMQVPCLKDFVSRPFCNHLIYDKGEIRPGKPVVFEK